RSVLPRTRHRQVQALPPPVIQLERDMQIGFIGLGAMGGALAANLLASGHTVRVFNRSAARSAPLQQAGATVAASPADAAREADAVFTMVSDDSALMAVTLG